MGAKQSHYASVANEESKRPQSVGKGVPPLNFSSHQLSGKAGVPMTFKSLNSVNPSANSIQSFDIDFTFNTIKDVKKVTWKESAPWFREIYDGFCWLAYC